MDRTAFDDLAAEVSNWGRWGDDDERGTLNLIDAAAVQRGLAAVVDGDRVSLAMPLDLDVPRLIGQPSRTPPLRTSLLVDFSFTGDPDGPAFNDDSVTMGTQACTHWDALSHAGYGGQLYNGFPASTVTAAGGASRCGIDRVGAVVSRGVLLDVARQLGVDAVAHGRPITPDDLDATLGGTDVELAPGDIVLIRTGAMGRLRSGDRAFYEGGSCGLHPEVARWFRGRDVAAYAVDALNPDSFPPASWDWFVPIHLLCLRDLGMIQGQNWVLDELADACAADGRWTFLLSATPEPITGASGAPVAPVAIR